MRALSLLYHDVVDAGGFDASGRRGHTADRFKMQVELFDRHLAEIDRRAVSAPTTVVQLRLDDRGGRPLPVLLTFDDGGSSAATHVAERLERRGWRGHFFVIGNQIGEEGFLTASQIRALHEHGHVVGTHTFSHPRRLSHLPKDEIVREWRLGAEVLGDVLGEAVSIGSVPGGFYSPGVARAADHAGLRAIFTSEPTAAVGRVEGCSVFGRYSLFGESSSEKAGCFAAGDFGLRARQWAFWNTKKVLKRVGGEGYFWLRQKIVGRSSGGGRRREPETPSLS